MNLNKITTPEEIFTDFHFKKWKKMKSFFWSKPMSYSTRESLDTIKIFSFILGSVALFAELIISTVEQHFVGIPSIIAGVCYLPAIFIYGFPYVKKIGNYFVDKIYGSKFKKHMTEARLKNFITILSSHECSPYYMKNLNYYDNFILAFHHNKKDFIHIGFNLMNSFYTNFSEKNRENKNKQILENFYKKPIIDFVKSDTNGSKKEDKFLFM